MFELLLPAVVAWLCRNDVEGVYAEWMLSVFAVLPLLLLFCLCGGAGGAGDFKLMPFDAKELLVSYNIEGPGEDKVCDTTVQGRILTDWFWKQNQLL